MTLDMKGLIDIPWMKTSPISAKHGVYLRSNTVNAIPESVTKLAVKAVAISVLYLSVCIKAVYSVHPYDLHLRVPQDIRKRSTKQATDPCQELGGLWKVAMRLWSR